MATSGLSDAEIRAQRKYYRDYRITQTAQVKLAIAVLLREAKKRGMKV